MSKISNALLKHYDTHARTLPWRGTADPYAIWLSEIMLQQTTVATVQGYYARFLEVFPTVFALAAADEQQVLTLWQGLGYYSRARNLHKCARTVVADYGGTFPTTQEELLKLPGIGPYTAAAIAALAFNRHATVVDGNVERVISRLYRIATPLPQAKKEIKAKAEKLTPKKRPGDYAGAIMDLGATICTPRNPKCDVCPLSSYCAAHKKGDMTAYPVKAPKKKKPEKTGKAYCLFDAKGRLLLQQRPEKGLLANLWEVPHENWEPRPLPATAKSLKKSAIHKGQIKHVFTHFTLYLDVYRLDLEKEMPDWVPPQDIQKKPLPTLMRKVLEKTL